MIGLSTTLMKYIALVEGVKEIIWLNGVIMELEITLKRVKISYDSQSVIQLINNQNTLTFVFTL